METPQYLLKLTQRLPVVGLQLSLGHCFWPGTYHRGVSPGGLLGGCVHALFPVYEMK